MISNLRPRKCLHGRFNLKNLGLSHLGLPDLILKAKNNSNQGWVGRVKFDQPRDVQISGADADAAALDEIWRWKGPEFQRRDWSA